MPAPRNIAGQRFGRLVALDRVPRVGPGNARWNCVCDCGARMSAQTSHLLSGAVRSCGCLRDETSTKTIRSVQSANVTHGLTHSPTYGSWRSMVQRCTNPRAISFPRYGARGVAVCERWRSFENFLADMGKRPAGKTIDRIDNAKGYEPGNCRWATASEQNKNRRKSP